MKEKGLKRLFHRIVFKLTKPFLMGINDVMKENERRLFGYEDEKNKIARNQADIERLFYETKVLEVMIEDGLDLKLYEEEQN